MILQWLHFGSSISIWITFGNGHKSHHENEVLCCQFWTQGTSYKVVDITVREKQNSNRDFLQQKKRLPLFCHKYPLTKWFPRRSTMFSKEHFIVCKCEWFRLLTISTFTFFTFQMCTFCYLFSMICTLSEPPKGQCSLCLSINALSIQNEVIGLWS